MSLRPLQDNILIKRLEEENKTTASGIILAKNDEISGIGIVISTGSGRKNANGSVSEISLVAGDKILFNKFAGTEVTVEDNNYLIMKEADILGVFEN